MRTKKDMPEVPSILEFHKGPVDWVGMENMEMSVLLGDFISPASVDAFINLTDQSTRGVHMSRIYESTFSLFQKQISPSSIKKTLEDFINKHKEVSSYAKIRVRFDLPKKVLSLISEQEGWRNYPIKIHAQLKENYFSLQIGCSILYSSTCPCSLGLSKQLIQENFSNFFKNKSLISVESVLDWIKNEEISTPHSQRSIAEVFVQLNTECDYLPYENFVKKIRSIFPMEVQAAVKREDEQDFARINGKNLVFCEDACRKIAVCLQEDPTYSGYHIKVSHEESLHPHNAVSILSKNFESF